MPGQVSRFLGQRPETATGCHRRAGFVSKCASDARPALRDPVAGNGDLVGRQCETIQFASAGRRAGGGNWNDQVDHGLPLNR